MLRFDNFAHEIQADGGKHKMCAFQIVGIRKQSAVFSNSARLLEQGPVRSGAASVLPQGSVRMATAGSLKEDVHSREDNRQFYVLYAWSLTPSDEPLLEQSLAADVVSETKQPSRNYATTGIANLLKWRAAQIQKGFCE
jgi:hypothetical protein